MAYLKDGFRLQHRQPLLRRGVKVRQLVHVDIAVAVTILPNMLQLHQ